MARILGNLALPLAKQSSKQSSSKILKHEIKTRMEAPYFHTNQDKGAMETLLFPQKSTLMSTNASIVSDLLLSLTANVLSNGLLQRIQILESNPHSKVLCASKSTLHHITNFWHLNSGAFIVKEFKNRIYLWICVKKAALEYYFLT